MYLIESLPIAAVCFSVTLVMLVSCELGFYFGVRDLKREDDEASSSLGPMVGGLLGMLGFVLAFTFSMAASQHDIRKHNVLDEANTIGTVYLRADLLDENYRSEVKRLLRQYVDVRLQAVTGDDLDGAIAKSTALHRLLWAQVAMGAAESPNTNTSLVVQATNDLIDLHTKRLAGALGNRIPVSVWVALLVITVLSMITMGMQVGLGGKRRLFAVVPLSLAFAVLVTLVVDLNRPQSGLITVSQSAMLELRSDFARDSK